MTFSELWGQEPAVAMLRHALRAGRLSHAYLFTGPRGVGKGTLALALAQALNCEANPGEGCGACDACRRLASGVHPDLLVLEREGQNIGIGQVRRLQEVFSLHPYVARRRLAIVREADVLSREAANCFLKTLEEPPASSLLVLTTERPDVLLHTIRSRCQRIALRPLSSPLIVRYLVEEQGWQEDKAALAAAWCRGSPGAAQNLDVALMAERRSALLDLLQRLPELGEEELIGRAEDWLRTSPTPDDLIHGWLDPLALLLRDLAACSACPGWLSPSDPGPRQALSELAARYPTPTWLGFHESAQATVTALRENVNRTLALEHLLLELLSLERDSHRG